MIKPLRSPYTRRCSSAPPYSRRINVKQGVEDDARFTGWINKEWLSMSIRVLWLRPSYWFYAYYAIFVSEVLVIEGMPAMAQGSRSPSIKDITKRSMQNLREYADLPRDPENPTYWESFKQGYRKFNSDVNQTLDFKNAFQQWGHAFDYGRREVGKAIDKAGADIHAIARSGYGMYYGNSPEEISKDIADNYVEVAKNQSAGREGTETLRTAKAYMEGAEDLSDEAAKEFIAKTFGGTIAPWAAGKIAKALANVFTGLAKGIYAVLDPSSTSGEMAVGIAEIVLAGKAGDTTGYGEGMQAFKSLLTKALGLGSMQECLKVVLDQYKEDMGKAVLGDVIDGKNVLISFGNFLGIDRKMFEEMFEEFRFEGNYVGTIAGGAQGKLAFTIQGSTWQGSFKGVIPWEIKDTTLSGEMPFSGTMFGTYNEDTMALEGEITGNVGGGDKPDRFAGKISGAIARDVGGKRVARGSWSGQTKTEQQSGTWTATQ